MICLEVQYCIYNTEAGAAPGCVYIKGVGAVPGLVYTYCQIESLYFINSFLIVERVRFTLKIIFLPSDMFAFLRK